MFVKNGITRFLNKIIIFTLIFLININLMALDYGEIADTLNENALDRYLDHADMAENREEWRKIAQFGAQVIVSRWEADYITTGKAEDTDLEILKGQINEMIEDRYTRWISASFFEKERSFRIEALVQKIKEANEEFLYERDGDGNIRFKDEENIDADKVGWIALTSSEIDKLLEDFTKGLSGGFAELLSVPGVNAEKLTVYFNSNIESYKDSYRWELERVNGFEYQQFLTRRLRDQESLRKDSEDGSASAVASDLIKEAEKELNAGLLSLEQKLRTPSGPDGNPLTEIDADSFRADFQCVFDKGMDMWDQAEKKLLMERMTWEKRSYETLENGEARWVAAFDKLKEAQVEWQGKLRSLLETGTALWSEKEESLSTAVNSAREEMEAGITARNGSLEEQLENLLSLYLDSLKMVAEANDSLAFWEEHVGDENAAEHYEFWNNTKTSYSGYLEDAGERLVSLFGIVLTNDGEHGRYDDLSGYGEKYGIDKLLERSTEDKDWENFTLDDYQVDLIKARVTKEYWDKQFAIAEAVYNYSMDESSDRPSAEETKGDYEASFLNFKLAEEEYTDALSSLKEASTGMNVSREAVTAAKSILDERKNTLAQLRDEMETLRRIAEDEMGSVFQNEITNLYKQLRLEMGFDDSESTPYQLKAAAYFASAKAYGIETAYDSLSLRVYNLIKGDEEASGVLSLAALKDRYKNADAWQFSDEEAANGAAALSNLGLEPTDLLYGQLLQEYSWYGDIDLISADNATMSKKKLMKLLSKKRIESLSGLVKSGFKNEYLARVSEISALTSRSPGDWLTAEEFDAEEYLGLTNTTMSEAALVKLGETAYGRYLYEKSKKEKALTTAMSLYLDSFSNDWNPEDPGALAVKLDELPAEAKSGTNENIDNIAALLVLNAFVFGFFTKTSLKNIISTWTEGYDQVLAIFRNGGEWHLSTEEYLEPLRGLSAGDPIVSRILKGMSLSLVSAPDILVSDNTKMFETGDLFLSELTDIIGRKDTGERLRSVYFNTLSISPALAVGKRAAAIDGLETILNNYAIETNRNVDGVLIPDTNVETVWNNYEESGMSLALYFARLRRDVIEAASILPEYYISEIVEYIDLIGRYLTSRGAREGTLADVDLPSDISSIYSSLQELTLLSAPAFSKEDPGIAALDRLMKSRDLLLEMKDSFSFKLSSWGEGTDPLTLSGIDKQIEAHYSQLILRRLGTSFASDSRWMDVDYAQIDEVIEYITQEYSFIVPNGELKDSITKKVLILSRQNALLAGELALEDMSADDKAYMRNLLSNGYIAITSLLHAEPDETYISVLKDLWSTLKSEWGADGISTEQADAYLEGRLFSDEERVIAEGLLDSLHLKTVDNARLSVVSLTNEAAGITGWIHLLAREADLKGSFYNRSVQGALASMMDSDENLELASWILEINGITSLSVTAEEADLFNSADSLEEALLSFAGKHEKELLWRKILETNPDVPVIGVSPETAQKLSVYAGQLNAARRRLSAFDYDKNEYLLETAGITDSEGFLSASNVLSGIGTKDGASFAYTASDMPPGVIAMNIDIERAYSQGFVDLIYKSAVRSLGFAGENLNLLNTRKNFLAEYQMTADRFENKLTAYRGYLGANYLNPDYVSSNSEDLAINITNSALISEVPDEAGLTVFNSTTANSGNFFENEYLEIVSLLNIRESLLEAAGAHAGSVDLESGSAAAYFSLFENYEAMDIESILTDDFDYQVTKTDRDLAFNSYKFEADKLETIKNSIASAGYNYYISQNSAERMIKLSEMNDKRVEMENVRDAYEEQLNIWKTAVDAMGGSQDIYSDRYRNMEDAETLYNQQLFSLEKSEAVFKYASSAYLGDAGSLSDAEKAALSNTVDPEGKLNYVLKQRAFAHAEYNALADIPGQDSDNEFTDFAERDNEYKTIYETYLKEAKNRIVLRKLSDLVGGQLAGQQKVIEASKEVMDKNIAEGIYNEVNPANLDKAGLDMTSFMTLSFSGAFGGSYPAYSFSKNLEPGLVLYKNSEGIDVFRSISKDADHIDGNGEATHIFLTDNARNKYFYFGGTAGALIDSYGFTQKQAIADQSTYNSVSKKASYYNDKIDWMDRMAVFTNGKDPSGLFARWAKAVWYKRSKEAEGSSSNFTPEEQFWTKENSNYQYTSVMGTDNGDALQSHTNGEAAIAQFKGSAREAYNTITGEEKELFNFFLMSQSMDKLVEREGDNNFINQQMRLVLGEKFRDNVNPSIAQKEKEYSRNMLIYVAAYAVAIGLLAGFFTAVFGIVAMVATVALQLVAIGMGQELGDLKKEANNIEDDIYGVSGSRTKIQKNINSSVTTINSTIKTHAALHSIYQKNVSDMAVMQGGIAEGELLNQIKLRGSILKALVLKGTDLKSFLNLSNNDLIDKDGNPISAESYLANLLNPYQNEVDIVADEYKKDAGLYLQSYLTSSLHRYTKAAEALNNRADKLRLVQAGKAADYRNAAFALEAYYANSKVEIDSENPVESTVSAGDAWAGKTEEELLEDYKNAIDGAYLNSSFVERTHSTLLLETNLHILSYIDNQASSTISRAAFNDIEEQTLEEMRVNLFNLQNLRWSNYREAKESEWNQMQVNLQVKKQEWSNSLRAIMIRGNSEWRRANRTMAAERSRWLRNVDKRYTDKTEEWDLKYAGFLLEKSDWVDEVAGNAAVAGSESLNGIGSSAELAIRAATSEMVADLNINMPDTDAKVAKLTGNSLFPELLENAGLANAGVSLVNTKLNGFLGDDSLSKSRNAVLELVDKNMCEEKEKLEEELLLITAIQAKEQIEEAKMNFVISVEDANEGIAGSMTTMFYDAGWNLVGDDYTKEIVVDSTVTDGVMTEERRIKEFKEYDYRGDVSLDAINPLDPENLKGKGANFIEKTITAAMETIKNAFEFVFGAEDAESEVITKNLKDRVKQDNVPFLETAVRSVKNLFTKKTEMDDGTVEVEVEETYYQRPGAFNEHVGLAAELKTVPDMKIISDSSKWSNNFKYAGTGEMGRIMGFYLRYKLEESRGWAELNKPAWEARIFDDDGSDWFTSPTIKDVTDLTINVGASLMTGGMSSVIGTMAAAGAGVLFNSVDDVAFGMMDVAGEYKSADQAWSEVGIKTAANLVSAGLNMGFGGLTSHAVDGLTGAGKIAGLTAMKGAGMFTSNMASASISSITAGMQWDNNGNYTGFDNEAYGNAFINSIVGEGAIRSYFSSIIQTGIGSTMDYGFDGEFKGLLNGKYADSEAFKSVVTNSLTAGAEFAMFGDTSINVLNTSMFGLSVSQGLLSLNLSNDGMRGSLGGGGLNVNLGNMWKAVGVGSIFNQNNEMEESGFDAEELVAGRVLWSDGIDQTSKLLDELMSGDAVLNRDTLTDGVAKTTFVDGVKQIDLSKITEGDLGLMLGVILSHESMRNGVEGTQQEQAIETFRSVLTHSIVGSMVGNTYGMASLDAGVVADIKALQTGGLDTFARYALSKFDGSADFWKLIENGDGSLILNEDGRGGVFYNSEDGEEHEMGHYTGGSRTEYLQKIMNMNLSPKEKSRLTAEMLVGLGSAETFKNGSFIDIDGNLVSIDLTGEWSDRMGAALDYDRMFVDSWRNDGDMNPMIDQLNIMRIAKQYGADPSDREKYLMSMQSKAVDFSNRFEQGLATEHLFSQTEIENAAGFGTNSLCYATVPVNLYQLKDPSISLDMIGAALQAANDKRFVLQDGTVKKYNDYMKLLGNEFGSSQYLKRGSDYENLNDYLASDYSMADLGIYGFNDNEQHHKLLRNSYATIDPYKAQLSWSEIEKYRYRGLSWMDF